TYFLNKIQYNKNIILYIIKIIILIKKTQLKKKDAYILPVLFWPAAPWPVASQMGTYPKYLPISRAAHPPFHSPFDPFRPPTNPSVSPLTSESSQSAFPQHG